MDGCFAFGCYVEEMFSFWWWQLFVSLFVIYLKLGSYLYFSFCTFVNVMHVVAVGRDILQHLHFAGHYALCRALCTAGHQAWKYAGLYVGQGPAIQVLPLFRPILSERPKNFSQKFIPVLNFYKQYILSPIELKTNQLTSSHSATSIRDSACHPCWEPFVSGMKDLICIYFDLCQSRFVSFLSVLILILLILICIKLSVAFIKRFDLYQFNATASLSTGRGVKTKLTKEKVKKFATTKALFWPPRLLIISWF